MVRIVQCLKKTRSNSAPGPDGISWKLLKMIKDTAIGKAVLGHIAQVAEEGGNTRMPIVVQQLLPILTYGCELYPTPSEQQRRLANEMYRWAIGAYRGSRAEKVQELAEVNDIGVVMVNKRVR